MGFLKQFPVLYAVQDAKQICGAASAVHVIKVKKGFSKETRFFFVIKPSKELYVCPHPQFKEEDDALIFKKVTFIKNAEEVEVHIERIVQVIDKMIVIVQDVSGDCYVSSDFTTAKFSKPTMKTSKNFPLCLKNNKFFLLMWQLRLKFSCNYKLKGLPADGEEMGSVQKSEYSKEGMLCLDDAGTVFELKTIISTKVHEIEAFCEGGSRGMRFTETIYRFQFIPIKFDKPVVDIAACPLYQVYAVLTADGAVYMWGDDVGMEVPQLTELATLQELFLNSFNVPYKLFTRDDIVGMNKPVLAGHFDNEETSDLTIIVEGRPIYVHRSILKITSTYFKNMLDGFWNEMDNNVVVAQEDRHYEAYKSVLYFLYTNVLKIDISFAFRVLHLSRKFALSALEKECETFIIGSIEVQNVASIYVSALEYNNGTLESFCLKYATKNFIHFVKTQGYLNLEPYIMKRFQKAFDPDQEDEDEEL